MRPFAYARPGSLAEVYDRLEDVDPSAVRLIVGGTDLIVGLQSGKVRPELVVDLKHLADLPPRIEVAGDRLSISAPTSLTDVIADERVRTWFPALVEAASTVGSVQIRNRASLTGNICNAYPAYDTATALLVHDAEIVLGSRAGTRRVPVRDFVLGPRSTDLRHGRDRHGRRAARARRAARHEVRPAHPPARGRPRHPQPVLRRRRAPRPVRLRRGGPPPVRRRRRQRRARRPRVECRGARGTCCGR